MTAQGFTGRMTGTGYDTTTGGDHAVGLADKVQATPGAATLLTWSQSVNASDRWAGITFALRPVPANIPPTVSITSPANNAIFSAPANIALAANAADTDGTLTKVEFFHGGTNLIATVTAAPYTFNWTNVAAASYTLTAVATDNQNGPITSAPVNVTVNTAVAQLYYIHTDHLNTPRLISNATSQVVWRWDHTEPFGADMANGNPSGLGAFEFNLRLPGQYFDKETNLHYNYFRDYDPGIGRYVQSDPIGLEGGVNTYAYVNSNPLSLFDLTGLQYLPLPGRPVPPNVYCAFNPELCAPAKPSKEQVCFVRCTGTTVLTGIPAEQATKYGLNKLIEKYASEKELAKLACRAVVKRIFLVQTMVDVGQCYQICYICGGQCAAEPATPTNWNSPLNANFPRIPTLVTDR